ncbi:hypothetical protein ACI65C_001635 [Semiaphis heraclei]
MLSDHSGTTQFSCSSNLCLLFVYQKPIENPKMGAEKVTMNIIVVGQVQSAKAINSVAKSAPATSQLMNC